MNEQEMRVLTVRQPWAWAILHGGKGVENRSRNIAGGYRGPIAIHAGVAAFEKHNLASALHRSVYGKSGVDTAIHFGAIFGVVDLVDVHKDQGQESELCSEWAHTGAHHLVLENPRPLAKPIPFKGALGLRKLDADVMARVLEAVSRG